MQDQLTVDTTLNNGRYTIKSLYKKGGQCLVYIANDLRDSRQVIIKQPEEVWAQDALRQEGDILASLDHPSLPRFIDRFEEQGSTFLVTTYIPGADLDELLRERGCPFSISEVVGWAEQLLDILEYLQRQETTIVHRDINPRNIRRTPENLLFLLDFGVAKKINKKTLLIGGSPHYAPPEQLRDEGTDHRSDIYSFAATLYFLLTATEPRDSQTRTNAIGRRLPDPLLPASQVNNEVPLYLCRLLTEAMSLERGFRPGSAAVFRRRLRAGLLGMEEGEEETETSPRQDDDPDITAIRARATDPSSDPGRVIETIDRTPPNTATQMAKQLLDEQRVGEGIHQDVIQIIIELMDARPSARPTILRRYRSILNSRTRTDPPLAFNFIESLARNSAPDSVIHAELHEALSKRLAKSPTTNLPTNIREKDSSQPLLEDLISPDRIYQIEGHRQWLRQFLIWIARGMLLAFGVKLVLLLIRGKFTLIDSLLLANLLLIAYSVCILILIRKMGRLDRHQVMKYAATSNLAGFFYGVVITEAVAFDLLSFISQALLGHSS